MINSEQNLTSISTISKYLVVCLSLSNYTNAQLVADHTVLTDQSLDSCPKPRDQKMYQDITNSINLAKGIKGPGLTFSYVPNTTYSIFYPIYQDYFYQFSKKTPQYEEVPDQIYWVTSAGFQQYNVFGELTIWHSYQNASVYIMKCQISDPQDQFSSASQKLKLEINHCAIYLFREVTNISQTSYFEIVDKYEFYIQFQPAMIYICQQQTDNCNLVNVQDLEGISIQQVMINPGPTYNSLKYFVVTLIQNDRGGLFTYTLEINTTQNLAFQIPIITRSYLGLKDLSKIIQFGFVFLNEHCQIIMNNLADVIPLTQGPVTSLQQPLQKNYTFSPYMVTVKGCQDMVNTTRLQFLYTNVAPAKQKYFIVICTNNTFSLIYQYLMNSAYDFQFWRILPLYDNIVNSSLESFITDYNLYVPVHSYSPFEQIYLVYNLKEFSVNALQQKYRVPLHEENQKIIAKPILNSIQKKIGIAQALILSGSFLEVNYINKDANLIFNIQPGPNSTTYNQTIQADLIVSANQMDGLNLFRIYNIFYNFNQTAIQGVSQPIYQNVTNSIHLKKLDGYYQYLLLLNEAQFRGPIVNYYAYSQNPNVQIVPSSYMDLFKLMGSFADTVGYFGLVTQIISLSSPSYESFFQCLYEKNYGYNQTYLDYLDLLLVLTKSSLLFYQKASQKKDDPFSNCNNLNYLQSDSANEECQIRLLNYTWLTLDPSLICKMQLNQIGSVLILCQVETNLTIDAKLYANQRLQIVNFTYNRNENSLNIYHDVNTSSQSCYCYFLDLKPYSYKCQVYQVVKHTYLRTNTFFGIYQFFLINGIITPKRILTLPAQGVKPYGRANDFTLVLNGDILSIIILLNEGLVIQQVNLLTFIPLPPFDNVNLTMYLNSSLANLKMTADFILLKTIEALNQQMGQYEPYQLVLSGPQFIFELNVSLTGGELLYNLVYIYKQYQLCSADLFEPPQFVTFGSSIRYLVSICVSRLFDYESIQNEMAYLFNVQNPNQIFLSLFRKNTTNKFAQPVQILEFSIENQYRFDFLKFQLYTVYSRTQRQLNVYMLLSNKTYFLLNFRIYSQQGFYLVFSEEQASHLTSIEVLVQAVNQYSQGNVTYILQWNQLIYEPEEFYFYFFMVAICLAILLIVVYLGFKCWQARKESQSQEKKKTSKLRSKQGGSKDRTGSIELFDQKTGTLFFDEVR